MARVRMEAAPVIHKKAIFPVNASQAKYTEEGQHSGALRAKEGLSEIIVAFNWVSLQQKEIQKI